jgi:hypothetical protein
MTRERARDVKDDLIVGSVDMEPPPGSGGTRPRLTPREGLSVSFVSAVEALRSQFASAVLLGVGMAVLLLLGVDRKENDDGQTPLVA